MQSALKFLVAGTALVVIVALGAIAYSLFGGRGEANNAAALQRPANAQDPASDKCTPVEPAGGYVSGNHVFRLSTEIFPPSPSLVKDIHDRYGSNAALADWGELKSMLASEDDVRNFIQGTGIHLQSANYSCDNVLVSRSGNETLQGMHYHLARHDGKVPKDWSVLDTIGANDINLGRWNHSGQALLRLPAQ